MTARLLSALSTTLFAIGALGAADSGSPPPTELGAGDNPAVRMFMVQMALPHAGETATEEQLPASIAKLLSEGWTIGSTVVVSRDTGASTAVVLFELQHHDVPNLPNFQIFSDPQMRQMLPGGGGAMPWHGMHREAGGAPGAGTPVAPADKGELTVHWTDGVTSVITVGEDVGVRAKAHVKTMDASGKVAAEYDCTAFKDASGATEVDGRGATVSPNNQEYSPDSFTIKADGGVDIEDDSGTRDSGHTDHPPAPATAPSSPQKGPGQERQL